MIPLLRKHDIFILNHLAGFRVEDEDYVPFGICRLGITMALNHPYISNICRSLEALKDSGLVREFFAAVKEYPEETAVARRSFSKIKCYQITNEGRAIVEGFRKAYPDELGVRA